VHLHTHSITACKCISTLTQSQPPSVSLNSHHDGLQVCTISAFNFIPNLARSRPPSASLSLLDLSLQVPLQTHSITTSKHIINERQLLYRDLGVREVDKVLGSIYLGDPGVDRHHLISISSYHTLKIHSIFPNFWYHLLSLRFCKLMQLRGSSTLGSSLSSQLIPTLHEPELLFHMNSIWMSQKVHRWYSRLIGEVPGHDHCENFEMHHLEAIVVNQWS
jgi:hypothetical protein